METTTNTGQRGPAGDALRRLGDAIGAALAAAAEALDDAARLAERRDRDAAGLRARLDTLDRGLAEVLAGRRPVPEILHVPGGTTRVVEADGTAGPPMLCEARLKERGWTMAEIRRELHGPDATAPNPRYLSGPPMRLYALGRVEEAERGRRGLPSSPSGATRVRIGRKGPGAGDGRERPDEVGRSRPQRSGTRGAAGIDGAPTA